MITLKKYSNRFDFVCFQIGRVVPHKTIAIALMILISSTVWADEPTSQPALSMSDIMSAMSAAEAQYSTLSLNYREIVPDWDSTGKWSGVVVFNILSKRDATKGLQFFDYQLQAYDDHGVPRPNTRFHNLRMMDDGVIAFDGTSTLLLNRARDSRGWCTADNLPGYRKDLFPQSQVLFDSYDLGWHYAGPASYPQMVKRASEVGCECSIAPGRETIEGLETTKILVTHKDTTGNTQVMIWICPNRSFLPVKMETIASTSDAASQVHLSFHQTRIIHGLMQLENGMWFPKEIIDDIEPAGLKTMVVFQSASSATLKIADFHPRLPPATMVQDSVSGGAFVTPPAPTSRPATAPSESSSDAADIKQLLDSYIRSARQQAGDK